MSLRRHSMAGLIPPKGDTPPEVSGGTDSPTGGVFSDWTVPIETALYKPQYGSFKDGFAYADTDASGDGSMWAFMFDGPELTGNTRRVITVGGKTDLAGRMNAAALGGEMIFGVSAAPINPATEPDAGARYYTTDVLPDFGSGPQNHSAIWHALSDSGSGGSSDSELGPILEPDTQYWLALEITSDGAYSHLYDADPGVDMEGTPLTSVYSGTATSVETLFAATLKPRLLLFAGDNAKKFSINSLSWFPAVSSVEEVIDPRSIHNGSHNGTYYVADENYADVAMIGVFGSPALPSSPRRSVIVKFELNAEGVVDGYGAYEEGSPFFVWGMDAAVPKIADEALVYARLYLHPNKMTVQTFGGSGAGMNRTGNGTTGIQTPLEASSTYWGGVVLTETTAYAYIWTSEPDADGTGGDVLWSCEATGNVDGHADLYASTQYGRSVAIGMGDVPVVTGVRNIKWYPNV